MPSSLYIHIPFCRHLCAYCDFPKVVYDQRWGFSYLEALKKELDSFAPQSPFKTVYIGGGTPSTLSKEELTILFSMVRPYLSSTTEFTIEANPEDLKEEKLNLFLENGVNRLSVGIESSSKRLLALMNRRHCFEEAKKGLELAKRLGFKRLSADLIYGLPGEVLEELDADIDAFLGLNINHLSAYCLSVNPMTAFYKDGLREMEEEKASVQYERILKRFREAGYRRYEVSNFARNGDLSRHNLVYWHDEEYIGIGLGASGYIGKKRYTNTKNLARYLLCDWNRTEETLTEESELEDYFLTNLRLDDGFALVDFEKRFGFSFLDRYRDVFEKERRLGLLIIKDGRLFATDRGIEILDSVLLSLF